MREIVLVSLAAAGMLLSGPARAAEPVKKTPQLLEKGKVSFELNCASCHGPKGEGDGVASAALTPRPRNFVTDSFKNGSKVTEIFDTVAKGIPGTAMIGFTHLPEDERWALAYFVADLKGGKSAPHAKKK